VLSQRFIAGVIVEFIAGETLLMIVAWVLGGLFGVGLLVLPIAVSAFSANECNSWSASSPLLEMTKARGRPGDLLPARCPVRTAAFRDRREPSDLSIHWTVRDARHRNRS
jgi:hypothetical protein